MNASPQLQIRRLDVKNYRSLRDVSLDFRNPMTVLIGRNAAGKSTLIDLFKFVSEAIRDPQAAIKARGDGCKDLTWGGQLDPGVTLRFVFDIPEEVRVSVLENLSQPEPLSVKNNTGNGINLIDPKITKAALVESSFFKTLVYEVNFGRSFHETIICSGSGSITSALALFDVMGQGAVNVRTASAARIWQLELSSGLNALLGENNHTENLAAGVFPAFLKQPQKERVGSNVTKESIDLIRKYFSSIYHGSPYRKASNALAISDNQSIDPEGTKLVQVLHTLNNNENRVFQKIQSDLKTLVDEIELISTPVVESTKTTLKFNQTLDDVGDVAFNLNQMSSGTIQLLILLTQIHTCEPNSLILLEEVESMLHPSAQAQLTKMLVSASTTRTIVLSTHSPIIASQSKSESISLVKKRRGVTTIHPYTEDLMEEIIEEMGIRPSFAFDSDKVIFVEGDFDEAVFRLWLLKAGMDSLADKKTLIDAQGYSKIQFYANARLLSRKVVTVHTYAVFDGDTKEKGDCKQAVQLLGLEEDHVLQLKARNLESLLANPHAIKRAFHLLPYTEEEIAEIFAKAGDIDARLKGALKSILRNTGGYTAENAVRIAEHIAPPEEWLTFFQRIHENP